MCLAVPLRISRVIDSQKAVVESGSSGLEVDISLLDDPNVGDYVIVHAGFAIEKLEDTDAEERIEMFDELGSIGT